MRRKFVRTVKRVVSWVFGRRVYTTLILIVWGVAAANVALLGLAGTAGGPLVDASYATTSVLTAGYLTIAGLLARRSGLLTRQRFADPVAGGITSPDWTVLSLVGAAVWMVYAMFNLIPNIVTLIVNLAILGFLTAAAGLVLGVLAALAGVEGE